MDKTTNTEIDNRTFRDFTDEEIDNKLQADVTKHNKKVRLGIIIAVIILLFLFRGSVTYWIKFGIAIPSNYTSEAIDTSKDPVQIDYSEEEQQRKKFTYHSLINNGTMEVTPQAHYVLSGKVIAYNHDFLFISKFFDSAALYDLGMAWGKLADKKVLKEKVKVYSHKVELTGARRMNWSWRSDLPYSKKYIISHLSHTHIIPANRNIMAAMLKLRIYQDAKLEGELVDMTSRDEKHHKIYNYKTSLSRSDTDNTSRGFGSCETMYVTKVQIGNKVYK